jgi:predicted nucleic-acid-binding protein
LSSKLEKTYIDSNVWFSYITKGKYEKTYDKARNIIDGIIANPQSVVVISDLVILEMVSILRSKVVQKESFTHTIKSESRIADALKWKIDVYTKEFLAKITESTMAKKLIAVESTIPMNEFSRRVVQIQRRTFGIILDQNFCPICKRPYKSYRYRGADYNDIQHAIMAQFARVNRFITFDRGYEFLKPFFNRTYEIQII